MLNAGIRGYSGSRGILGALRARAPRVVLVEELLNMSDADSCAAYLRQSPFLEGIETGSSLGDLQRALRGACVVFGRKITRFLGGASRHFIETHLLRYGIWNLKILFRQSVAPGSAGSGDNLYPWAACYAPPRQRATIDSPEKAVTLAEGSVIEKPARVAFEVYQKGEKDLFLFELTLDREYQLLLWSASRKVSFMEGGRLRRTLVIPGLGFNAMIWGQWLKSYHGMSPEEIMTLMALPEELVKPEKYIRYLQTGDLSSVQGAKELAETGKFLASLGTPQDIAAWHRHSKRFLWGRLGTGGLGTVFDICSLVTNLMRWEFIVDDAITVTSGKALGMQREEITPLLATQAA